MTTFAIVHDLLSGIENAPSGRAWFYLPATLTQIAIYGDDSGTATTNPVTLDSNGRARVYLSQLARMIVQDVNGATVVDVVINVSGDATVGVSSTAFTGTTVKAALDTALTAFGGQDFRYVPATGAGGMLPKTWMSGVHYNVLSFAATTAPTVNDGVTPADTAIAAAMAAATAAGGGVVYFSPGRYLCNSPIALTGVTGVSFRGAGAGVSTIVNNSGSGNCFTLTTCSVFFIEEMAISSSSGSTGTGVSVSGCTTIRLTDLSVTGHQIGIDVAGASTAVTTIDGCSVGTTTNAASRAIRYNSSGAGASFHLLRSTVINGSTSGKGVEYNGTISYCIIDACSFNSNCPTGVLFNAALTGTVFALHSSQSLRLVGTPIDLSGLATDPILRQWGNEIDGAVTSAAIPATFTPNRALGYEFHFRATSGGAATGTVAAPIPAPTTTMRGTRLTLRLTNASGGAVTWSLNAAYVLVGGTAPSGTDGTTVILEFEWDVQTSKWRERLTRAQTTT